MFHYFFMFFIAIAKNVRGLVVLLLFAHCLCVHSRPVEPCAKDPVPEGRVRAAACACTYWVQ